MATWLDGYKRQDFGTNGGSWVRQPAMICLHSTETGDHGWPGYSGGQSAPHFTIDPLTGEARQHVSLAYAARALKNPSGGVETNRGGPVQIEIIGTCDPERRGDKGWTFLPDHDGWDALGALCADIAAACGIPLDTAVSWKPYPGSYGTSASQRLSPSAWKSYRGVLGHQHVPENDHGDPGNIDIQAILEGGDMPTADEIAARVWQKDGLIEAPDRSDTDSNAYWAAASYIHDIGEWALTVRDYTTPAAVVQTVWNTDGVIASPDNYPTHEDNEFWAPASFLRNTATWVYDVHQALPDLSAQLNGRLDDLADQLARLQHRRPGHHRADVPLWQLIAFLALIAAAVSITWQAAS